MPSHGTNRGSNPLRDAIDCQLYIELTRYFLNDRSYPPQFPPHSDCTSLIRFSEKGVFGRATHRRLICLIVAIRLNVRRETMKRWQGRHRAARAIEPGAVVDVFHGLCAEMDHAGPLRDARSDPALRRLRPGSTVMRYISLIDDLLTAQSCPP